MTRTKILRLATAALVAFVVVDGQFGRLWYSGLCSLELYVFTVTDAIGPLMRAMGVWRIPVDLACPLGFLERSLAARQLLPEWPWALSVVVIIIALGRVFCAWMCPSVLLRRVFGDKARLPSRRQAAIKGTNWDAYSSYAILGGVLVASYIFQFPVFCLVCPVGLFFGALYAVLNVVHLNPPGLELVLFPAMLVLELWVLRDWCRSICPLGALYSIIGNFNRFLQPAVDKQKCFITTKGVSCQACKGACPEGIDLTREVMAPKSCTKCLQCSDRCPAKAINIRLWA